MPKYQRITFILGLIGPFAMAAPAAAAPAPPPASKAARPRPKPPRMSGPVDKPIPGDSRYPVEHPRPTGALLAPLPQPALRLLSEHISVRCRFSGGGCAIRHEYVVENSGDATALWLPFVSPLFGVEAELDGKRVRVTDIREKKPERRWSSSGHGVAPGSGKKYALGGLDRHRMLRHQRLWIKLGARKKHTITLLTNSVGGYDRFRRGRTQPEVSFALTRRKDYFVHHHELRLTDPAARPLPGGKAGVMTVEILHPMGLVIGSNAGLKCQTVKRPRAQQRCRGKLSGKTDRLSWSMAEKHKRPVGFFVSVGAAFNNRGTEALVRGGLSLMVRRRKDLVTLSVETDVKERAALAVVYQLFLPYTPSSLEMGLHFEAGMVLDVTPGVRPAIRLGAVFHFAFVRINLLLDVYPGELKEGGAPAWRGIAAAGIGF